MSKIAATEVFEDVPSVESEIDEHKSEVKVWIGAVSTLSIPTSHKGVSDRFVRDCQTLLTDLEACEVPTAADLGDFGDRKNSLEIQYHNLNQDLQ